MSTKDQDATTKTSDEMISEIPDLDIGQQRRVFFDPNLPRPPRLLGSDTLDPKDRMGSYTGSLRINSKNRLEYVNGQAQGPYDEVSDARRLLSTMAPLDKKEFLKAVRVALGGSYRPSKAGNLDSDVTAVGLVLRQANEMGRTVDVALSYMIESGGGFLDKEGSGSGRTYTVTSADDIKPFANELALSLYGRTLDPKTLNRVIRAVQQEEVGYQSATAGGGTVERSATPTNIITQELMDANPEEAMIGGTASVVEMVQRALGSA